MSLLPFGSLLVTSQLAAFRVACHFCPSGQCWSYPYLPLFESHTISGFHANGGHIPSCCYSSRISFLPFRPVLAISQLAAIRVAWHFCLLYQWWSYFYLPLFKSHVTSALQSSVGHIPTCRYLSRISFLPLTPIVVITLLAAI